MAPEGAYAPPQPLQMPAEFLEKTQQITFLGEVHRCPSPSDRYLKFFYGNWRKPKSSDRFCTIRCYDQRRLWRRQLRKVAGVFGGQGGRRK